MLYRILTLLCLLSRPAIAQQSGAFIDRDAMQTSLPNATFKQLEAAPDVFMEQMAGLILGYGGAEGLNGTGIANYLAVNKAYIRAREMRRFLVADLNNDAQVTLDEMNILIQTENARSRGRLLVGFYKADTDGNDTVSMGEVRSFAEARASGAITQNDASLLEALVTLDLNGDGYVSLDEIIEIVSAFQAEI